jgi:glutamate-5-semialdehyde dehydrogenase
MLVDKINEIVSNIGHLAKRASFQLSSQTPEQKNRALCVIADSIDEHRSMIKAENLLDIRAAEGLASSLIDRLTLSDRRIDEMIAGVRKIADLTDPIGKLITSKVLENGMELRKIRVPLGVIAFIFESRPNVMADVAALCIKSGNAIILRGGKEAEHSNRALMKVIDQALSKIEFTPFAVQLIPITDRSAVTKLCQLSEFIDLVIPRGGESLIKAIAECATVPVIKHYKGVCHIFVDESADAAMALRICHNAKCERPGVCNAAETILIHEAIAEVFLPQLYALFEDAHVEMRADERARAICPGMKLANADDFGREFLDLIVSIKIVQSVGEAIHHINVFGSHHSDAIITNDKTNKLRFTREVDSAAVYVNASTRFTDGGQFGLGGEMGISTDKLHARGPMGLEELTTYKWVGLGNGQIRS